MIQNVYSSIIFFANKMDFKIIDNIKSSIKNTFNYRNEEQDSIVLY